jgi:hypothetical protein
MQDTAEGFGQPIRQIFEPFFRDAARAADALRRAAALPRRRRGPLLALALPADRRAGARLARLVGLLQQGRISVYLLYSFLTLIAHAAGGAAMSFSGVCRSASRSSSRWRSRRC